MIVTVLMTSSSAKDQWRAELLEHSWQRVQQPGELVRLVASSAPEPLPLHGLARVVRTRCWNPHPYVADNFEPYNLPAGLLEWLLRERIDATLLLVDSESVLLQAMEQEVSPGEAIGHSWRDIPSDAKGPFGLAKKYQVLEAYCVNRQLKLPQVQFPLLIHSRDLVKFAARWLELTVIIRTQVVTHLGAPMDAHTLAYNVAAAEYRVPHAARKLATIPSDRRADTTVFTYREPVETAKGRILWDPEVYVPWQSCEPKQAATAAGRKFLSLLEECATSRNTFSGLQLQRPKRRHGVREALILDQVLLDIPGMSDPLTLNSSAAAIWKLCDNQRTVAEIAAVLEQEFDAPREIMYRDIELAIHQLRRDGALDLEGVS